MDLGEKEGIGKTGTDTLVQRISSRASSVVLVPPPLITVQTRWIIRPNIRRSKGSSSLPPPSRLRPSYISTPFRATTHSRPSHTSQTQVAIHPRPTHTHPSHPLPLLSPATHSPIHPPSPGPISAPLAPATTPYSPAAYPNLDQTATWPATHHRNTMYPPRTSSTSQRIACHLLLILSRSSTSASLIFRFSTRIA